MKRKFLAMALGLATLSLAIVPSAMADTGGATINVAAGTNTISGVGAYSTGLFFNFIAADTAAVTSTSDSSNTALGGSDYLEIDSALPGTAWDLQVSATDFTGTHGSYTFAAGAVSASALKLEALTSGSSVAMTANPDIGGQTCNIVESSVANAGSDVNLTNSAATVASYTVPASAASNCVKAVHQVVTPLSMTPMTTGFAASEDATSTITYTLLGA